MEHESLREAFDESLYTFADETAVRRCALLLQEHKLTEAELSEAYEIFAFNKKISTEVTLKTVQKFEVYLKKVFRQLPTQTDLVPPEMRTESLIDAPSSSRVQGEFTTPVKEALTGATAEPTDYGTPPPPPREATVQDGEPYLTAGKSFTARKKKGMKFRALNEHLPSLHLQNDRVTLVNHRTVHEILALLKEKQNCLGIEILDAPFPRNARFMKDTLKQKVAYIESRIVSFCQAMQAFYQMDVSNPIHLASQEPVWMCGMVCCDCDGRLNHASIKLLGSRTFAAARSIRMDISHISCYSLFPGQVIAIKATNPRGDHLRVTEIIPHVPRQLVRREDDRMEEDNSNLKQYSVFVAAGPFSSAEDLSYEALKEIVRLVEKHNFDLVILLGPFLDDQHPVIASGAAVKSFAKLFQQQVEPLLYKIEKACGHLLLVPSVRDVHHLPVFPQPPFPRPSIVSDQKRKCTRLSNPATFLYSSVPLLGVRMETGSGM